MLEPHLTGVTDFNWTPATRAGRANPLQYYWQDLGPRGRATVVPMGDQGFTEALSLARDGDQRALYQLRRIARRDPESERGQQALQLLHEVNV